MLTLNAIERRVIGTLIEKSLATPQNYPLSLNALTNGCNQKSARDPETDYTDAEVLESLQGLKRNSLATEFFASGGRVSKWEEAITTHLDLNDQQAAVMAELLLRGPQTEGELRGRASRMAEIPDMATLHQVFEQLGRREEPLVKRLSDPGRSRGVKWVHTLYPEDEAPAMEETGASTRTTVRTTSPALEERVTRLEARVAELEKQLGVAPEADGETE